MKRQSDKQEVYKALQGLIELMPKTISGMSKIWEQIGVLKNVIEYLPENGSQEVKTRPNISCFVKEAQELLDYMTAYDGPGNAERIDVSEAWAFIRRVAKAEGHKRISLGKWEKSK